MPEGRRRELVVELARQMSLCASDFGCELIAIRPVAPKRPWWRFR